MAKKKKKIRDDGARSITATLTTATESPGGFATLVNDERQNETDALRLRLAHAKKKSVSVQQGRPVAIISLADAKRIQVESQDDVIILSCQDDSSAGNDNEINIVQCAIAKVHIWTPKDDAASASLGSPQSPLKNKGLLAGDLQIQPSSFVDFLWAEDEEPTQMKAPSTPSASSSSSSSSLGVKNTSSGSSSNNNNAPESTPQKTASAATKSSSFSFNSFVEQHNLSTPSPRNSRKPATPQHRKQRRFAWIIPVDSDLGDRILATSLPTQSVKTLSVEMIDDTTAGASRVTIPPSALPIVECLVKATHAQRFLQVGESISVSFQGRSLHLRVTDIVPTTLSRNDELESVQKALSDLKLGDEKDPGDRTKIINEDGDDTETRLVSNVRKLDVKLFQIGPNSSIQFLSSSTPSSKPTFDAALDTSASTPKQYVAGLGTVVEHVRERLLVPLTKSHLYAHSPNLPPPRGLLLHGPSGVGKTCLAKQIASELSQYKCEVEFVNCVSLQSNTGVVGEAERQLSKHFRPSADGPKLLIFDDIHLICSKRGGLSPSGSTDQLAATLLALLDGVDGRKSSGSDRPMAILGITNDASSLDPALRRPGRLDYEVEVPIPAEPSERAEILKFHVGNTSTITDGEYLELAKAAKGFNGADCLLAAKEAVRFAIQKRPTDESVQLSTSDIANAIKTIHPSAIKAVTVEIPQVLWTDVGGMETVKKQLREAIELPLTRRELYQKLRIPAPRGVLLYGPPGTGKTLIARALATEGKMNFLAVKGPELLSKWLGESERALASLFRRARMASPSIIFFDEIDAIAAKRGSSDSSGGSRMLSQLLTELDGVVTKGSIDKDHQQERVVVIGATNRPDLLDSALTRPGRIDQMVYVGLPDQPSREKVFEVALKDRSCDTDVNMKMLAEDSVSAGFSGAELVNICREAALLALDDSFERGTSHPSIRMDHIVSAIQSTKKQITSEMLKFYTAYREGA